MALKPIRTVLIVALIFSAAPTLARAQGNGGTDGWFVKLSGWGKWVTLASAAGLTTFGAISSNEASDRFDILQNACRTDSFFCRVNSDGSSYLDPEAERLFQATLDKDSEAQRFLVAGQVTLLVSATMFLADLLNGDEGPENIPFSPLKIYSAPGRGQAGLRLDF